MSEQLTPARLQELRANTLKELPWKDFDTIFTHIDAQAETIRRLRAERRVTKGLHAKIDEQQHELMLLHRRLDIRIDLHDASEAKLDRVRDALSAHPKVCDIRDGDAPITCGWKSAVAELQYALDGGQACPSCAQCDGSGKIPYTDLDKRGRSVDIIVECPRHALARLAINGDTK